MKLPDEFVAKLIEAKLTGEDHMVIKLPNGRETCSCFFTWNRGDTSEMFAYNEEEVDAWIQSRIKESHPEIDDLDRKLLGDVAQ